MSLTFKDPEFLRSVSYETFEVGALEIQTFGQDLTCCINEAKRCLFESQFDRCLLNCDIVLDLIWEHLNTGHWKDVSISWRKGYNLVSCLKALAQFSLFNFESEVAHQTSTLNIKFKQSIKDIIRTCDMGSLMGCPMPKDMLSMLASYLHTNYSEKEESPAECDLEKCLDQEPPVKKMKPVPATSNFKQNIEIIHQPSIQYFQENFYTCSKPVIMKGCMDDWPAMNENKWNIGYIKKVAGWRIVPIEIGSKYTDDSWSQKLMNIEDFIEQYLAFNSKEVGYLAQHQLFDHIADLRKDIIVPDYCALSESGDIEINAWFGPGNTVSPLHQDEKDNIFCQVLGEKYFKLYNPMYTECLHVHENHLLKTTSQVDAENPDLELHPGFDKIPFSEFTLSAGDMLYIPSRYWHYVRSLSTSFSVSFWWAKTDDGTKINCL